MNRGYGRETKDYPKAKQEAILRAAGVKTIYWGDDLAGAIRAARKGEVLKVPGFRVLGPRLGNIEAAIDALHARGAAFMDAETGWRSDGPLAYKAVLHALTTLRGEKSIGSRQSDIGSLGGKESAKRRRKGRPPWSIIEPIYFDRTLSNDEMEAKVNALPGYDKDISYTTMWRHFGERKVLQGKGSAAQRKRK